ncbi:restriction endonuclease subunit S [Shewanella hafniensis]|uniref:restriction endonuclease subunit S n=2 Tax=Shewanella hafniensis TaxID=365590 RepID=UPI00200BAE5A|nr:restriction endonuclease subunit S [Shewanella hafniensis]
MSWPLVTLASIAEVVTGNTPSKADDSFFNGDIPFVTPGELDLGYVNTAKQTLTDKGAKVSRLIPANSVMVCCIGSLGKVGISSKPVVTNQQINSLVVNEALASPLYVYYFCRTLKNTLNDMAPKTTVAIVNKTRFSALKIPLPPLETQKQIAAVLEKADQLRKDCQKMEQELNSLAQSVFIEMFGDPVTNPKGWIKRELSEMLSVKHGFAFKSEFFTTEGEYVLLTPGNFKEEGGYWDRADKQKYYVGEIPKDYILEKNDLLLAMTEQAAGLLGSSILVPESNKYLHNQRLGLVKFKDNGQNTVFYSYLFNSKSVRLAIHSSSTGTKVKHTSPTKLEAIQVGVPPIALQNDFESIIRTIELNIMLNNKAKSDYEQSFNALMQKAFNGELNLGNAKT